MFFQEVENESQTVLHAFEQLDLRVELFNDPRKFLLNIRKFEPALLFIDLTTPKCDFALALIRTIRSMLGQSPPILALVKASDQPLTNRLKLAGEVAVIHKPIAIAELARRLANHVTTDGSAKALRLAPTAEVRPPRGLPPIITWHFEKLMPTLTELRSCLAVFDDNERQLKYYAETAQRYEHEIVQLVRTLRRSEEKLDLIQSLRLYGAENARNLLVALQLTDAAKIKVFTFNPKTNLPTEDVRKLIGYAIRSVEHFGEGSRYHEIAFNCGIVFDLLALQAQIIEDRKRPLLKLIDTLFMETMRKADQGFQLGKSISNLVLEKHVITTLMLAEAGKIAMALYFPDYLEMHLDLEKRALKPILRHIAEENRYGISHNLVGALICQVAPALEEAHKAVLFGGYPFMLKSLPHEEQSYALAALCHSL